MTFEVTKASDMDYRGLVEIKTIEELILFMEFHKSDVIVYRPQEDGVGSLCIYDDYVE